MEVLEDWIYFSGMIKIYYKINCQKKKFNFKKEIQHAKDWINQFNHLPHIAMNQVKIFADVSRGLNPPLKLDCFPTFILTRHFKLI